MPQATARAPRADLEQDRPSRPRRTVTITGHPDPAPPPRRLREVQAGQTVALPSRGPRLVEMERRRPPRSATDRLGARPDRIAMWAVVMAVFLILVAATSSQAAV